MAIDTSIYGNIKQVEIESPVNALAKLLQVQGLQQDHQLGQMKMDEYQRGLGEQNALRALLGQQGFDPSTTEGKAKLYGTSIKGAQDFYKNAAEVDYKKAETDAKNIEAAHNRIDLIGQGLGFLKDNPTMENAQGVINNFVQMGIMTPEVAQQKMLDFQKDPTPEGIKNLATMGFQAAIAGKEQLPKIQTSNIGGSTVTQAFDPVSGDVKTLSTVQNTATPGDILNDKRVRAEGAANRAQSERHFQAGQNTPQYMETEGGIVALPKKLAPGQVPVGMPVTGSDGQPLSKPLKPIPASVNTAIIANKQSLDQINRALTLLAGDNVGDPTAGGMQGDRNATGVKGYLPNGLLNRIDPKGVATRAEIGDIGSLKIHDRSGAAVTVSESPRLMPFVPLATDDAATAEKKLRRLALELGNESAALNETYSRENGYKPSPVKPTATPPAGGGKPPPKPRPGAVEGGFRFKGGNPADRNSWEKV